MVAQHMLGEQGGPSDALYQPDDGDDGEAKIVELDDEDDKDPDIVGGFGDAESPGGRVRSGSSTSAFDGFGAESEGFGGFFGKLQQMAQADDGDDDGDDDFDDFDGFGGFGFGTDGEEVTGAEAAAGVLAVRLP